MSKKKRRKNKNSKDQSINKKLLNTIESHIEEPTKPAREAEFSCVNSLDREVEPVEVLEPIQFEGLGSLAEAESILVSEKEAKSETLVIDQEKIKKVDLKKLVNLNSAKLPKVEFSSAMKTAASTFKKGLNRAGHFASVATKAMAIGFKELRMACLKNKKCALSAVMAALSLMLGLTALLSLPSTSGLDNRVERENGSAIVNTAEPLVHNHKMEDPAEALSHYSRLSVTGVPLSVGLAQPNLPMLSTEEGKADAYKPGDSCEVVYEPSLAKVSSALNVENPFNIFKTVYNLRVNSEIVASFKTPNEAKKVMDEIVARNTSEKSEIVKLEYKENVEVTKDEASFLEESTYSKVEDAVNFLMTGMKEMQKYTIVAGDIPETIAEAHGMTIDELEAANPSIVGRGHLLQIGEELNLVIPKPLVNVLTTERRSYVKNVDYEVVEHEDAEMFEGEVVVEEDGEYGRSEVVAEVVRENGREIARTILSEKVLKEPKKEIVTVGTKPAPPRKGSGYLDYPLQRGFVVTSGFGERWQTLHTGIDLACDQGTPIVAADGGIVTFAGWDELGGLMVKIDHGGGISTGYAHCDYLAVSEGEMVFKGQYIADVGLTGLTTGSHLHFEVLINGVHTNPEEYLAFYY